MRTLDEARAVCETYLPGLYADLANTPLLDLEEPGNPGLELFRKHGGPALLIPEKYAGLGVSPLEAVQVVRAIGSCAPSLAVATAMHHFSVASIFTLADSLRSSGVEWALLEAIASQQLLVSSGFAEGNPGQGILSPTVTGVRTDGGIVINGSKKPCSMSKSMDLLSASVAIPTADGDTEVVLVLVPAGTPGISIHPFWSANVLTGAESDEVRLTDVFIDNRLAIATGTGEQGELDELQTVGFVWFELLITSCYLGMASALTERVFSKGKLGSEALAALGVRLETATLLIEGIARLLSEHPVDNSALTKTMIARYGAQDAIADAVTTSVEALGGTSFIGSPEVAYLASACRCVSFHPPSRSSTHGALTESFAGDIFRIQ